MPRGDLLEVRADGLWAELVCETPMEHWGYALEAFGVRLDDPADAYGREWGERLPVGLDLEWEAAVEHDEHWGTVRGELLIGGDRISFDGRGARSHERGESERWHGESHWAAFQIGDELAVDVAQHDGTTVGALWRAGDNEIRAVTELRLETHLGRAGIPTAVRYVIDHELEVDAEVLAAAPVPLGHGRLPRALCRFSTDIGAGTGWAEWFQPAG